MSGIVDWMLLAVAPVTALRNLTPDPDEDDGDGQAD